MVADETLLCSHKWEYRQANHKACKLAAYNSSSYHLYKWNIKTSSESIGAVLREAFFHRFYEVILFSTTYWQGEKFVNLHKYSKSR